MIDGDHGLSITGQAKALGISRGSVYYLPRPVSPADLTVMRRMDELHLEFPFAGSRMLRDLLNREGVEIGLWRTFGAAMQKRCMQPFRGRSGPDDNALKRREHHP